MCKPFAKIGAVILLFFCSTFVRGEDQVPSNNNDIPAIAVVDYTERTEISGTDGAVLFMTNDNPDYADPDYADSQWIPMSVPAKWETLFPEFDNIGWYRIHFTVPDHYPDEAFAIYLDHVSFADETYLNGYLIGNEGTMEGEDKVIYAQEKHRIYQLPTHLLNVDEENVIAIRVRGGYFAGSGLYKGNFFFQYYDDALKRMFQMEIHYFIFLITYIVVGLYFILFYLRQPELKSYILFGLFSLFLAYYVFQRTQIRFFVSDNYTLMKKTEYLALFTLTPLFTAFIFVFFHEKQKWYLFILYGVSIIGMLLVLFSGDPNFWSSINFRVVQPTWLLALIGFSGVIIRQFRKNPEARMLFISTVIIVLFAVNDALVARNYLQTPLMISYGFFLVVISISLILANRFVKLYNQVEDLNVNLESKVQLRTKELQYERNLLREKNGQIERELEFAKNIQIGLIPNEAPISGLAFFYKPMDQVGGDYFDFVRYDNGDVGIFISDVSGHGLPAAFVATMVSGFVKQYGKETHDPAQFLSKLNKMIYGYTGGNFITAFYGIFNAENRTFRFCNAGHNPPYLIHKDSIRYLIHTKRGIPLGVLENNELEVLNKYYENEDISLSADSKLLLYTDGLIEAVSFEQPMQLTDVDLTDFGETELMLSLDQHRHLSSAELLDELVRALYRFRGADHFEDDVCIICLHADV